MAVSPKRRRARPANTRERCIKRLWTFCILAPFAVLLSLWVGAALYFLAGEVDELDGALDGVDDRAAGRWRLGRLGGAPRNDNSQLQSIRQEVDPYDSPTLLSRHPKVSIASSARGNLGPPSVLNQDPPGKDWIRDRWQAASDMGGTALPGSHWVALDFSAMLDERGMGDGGDGRVAVFVTKVVLDWEAAYAKDYRIEGRMAPPKFSDAWCVLYDTLDNDTNDENAFPQRTVEEYGQSPGVKQKMPLHVVHTIDWSDHRKDAADRTSKGGSGDCHALRYLRVFIRKPARGWGVSLWEVDVFGTIVNNGAQH
ncbi:hypothetical protein ACHAXT_003660 [Thalassiosira profunda]